MNRRELDAALSRAGLQEYEIEGVHEPPGPPEAFLYLRREAGRWVVGVYERGDRTPFAEFDDEEGACRYFHSVVSTKTPPPPPPRGLAADGGPAPIAALARRLRDAWAEYRRAREGRPGRRDRPGPPPRS